MDLLTQIREKFRRRGRAEAETRMETIRQACRRLRVAEDAVCQELSRALAIADSRSYLRQLAKERDPRSDGLRQELQSFRNWFTAGRDVDQLCPDDAAVVESIDRLLVALPDSRKLTRLCYDPNLVSARRRSSSADRRSRSGRPPKPEVASTHESLRNLGVRKKADRISLMKLAGIIEGADGEA